MADLTNLSPLTVVAMVAVAAIVALCAVGIAVVTSNRRPWTRAANVLTKRANEADETIDGLVEWAQHIDLVVERVERFQEGEVKRRLADRQEGGWMAYPPTGRHPVAAHARPPSLAAKWANE